MGSYRQALDVRAQASSVYTGDIETIFVVERAVIVEEDSNVKLTEAQMQIFESSDKMNTNYFEEESSPQIQVLSVQECDPTLGSFPWLSTSAIQVPESIAGNPHC